MLYVGNTNIVELNSLKDSVTGDVDEGATVTLVVKDMGGAEVPGETYPLAMPHVSNGNYLVNLDSGLGIEACQNYQLCVTALGSSPDSVGYWEHVTTAEVRR